MEEMHQPSVETDKVSTPPRRSNEINNVLINDQNEFRQPTNGIARCYQKLEKQLLAYNFEARGIRRVEAEEKHNFKSLGYLQVGLLWFSINLAANNITLGMLGPSVFYLSFLDSALSSVMGGVLGCMSVAYLSTYGPRSGLRTLVISRYVMGWWPTKVVVVLNLISFLGYAMIDAVVAGQVLSAISTNGSLSIVVGIIIAALITWVICSFGYVIIHQYERYAWISQLIVFSILVGVAGQHFDLSTPTEGDAGTRVAARLSYFGICFSAAITYSAAGSDYFVYYPEKSSSWLMFLATLIGLTTSFTFAFLLGIGLASGIHRNVEWKEALDVSQGALLVEGFAPLGAFGKFCSVVVALGLIANMIPPTYSSGVDAQLLGKFASRVPRLVWNLVGVVIYTVCALAGRKHLAEIFTNFLALMGYWCSIWIAIFLEERYIFKRNVGFNWDDWNSPKRLPIGIAAILAFLVGWAGAIISMSQVWYVGPIAKSVGEYGADMGNYVAFSWTVLVYPPLRYFELRRYGR